MTPRERFVKLLNFEKIDKMPKIEWAAWWDETVRRWKNEGLDKSLDYFQILSYFDMENLICLYAAPSVPAPKEHGGGVIFNEKDYIRLREALYSEKIIDNLLTSVEIYKGAHERGEISIRLWLDGFFWYPRRLFGIEGHLLSFYDYPELLHQINEDLAEFNIRAINRLYEVLVPDMVGFAEDMSYNHGPMLSYEHFSEFLLPYYKKTIPNIKKKNVKVFTDSDGDITEMIPWLRQAGIEGVYPLEKQAGVDIVKIRENYPDFLMMGGYDKMVMNKGEAAMRAEFERLMPVVKSGGYILSVDHQTPPGVSLEDYRLFARLYEEYSNKINK